MDSQKENNTNTNEATGQTSDSGEGTSKKMKPEEAARCVTPPPGPTPIMVPPSPPRFVSMEEVMKAAEGVSNMTLAHEIAVDNDFVLDRREFEGNSFEKQVKDVMKQAFWDSLQERLNEDPPDYSQAILLIGDVKGLLLDLLMPHQVRFKQHIEEVLDLTLIEQKSEHGAMDVHYYANFVISIMERFCAPVRDDEVAALKSITDIVPLFKEIIHLLELMKMDMANFTIQQMRPLIQKHSVEYERAQFQKFLKTQEENNLDGLLYAKEWLTRSYNKFSSENNKPSSSSQLPSGATAASPSGSNLIGSEKTPALILNKAYMELLDWDPKHKMPETLLMDQDRFFILQERTKRLTLICSILLVTYNTVGAALTGIKDFKDHLREQIMVILADVSRSEVHQKLINVSDHVIIEVNKCLEKHGFPVLDESRQKLLQGQIQDVASEEHMVHQLLKNRITGFIHDLVKNPKPQGGMQLPPGVSAVSQDLSELIGQFLRLISHNRAVFGNYYVDIIQSLSGEPSDM